MRPIHAVDRVDPWVSAPPGMARALIVGCGCRGRELAGGLIDRGWLVRGTTRDEARFDPIRAAGIEPALADPDRSDTVLRLVADISVVVWLLGGATGPPETVAAIHGPRLERLLEKLVDTPVRGFAYQPWAAAPPAEEGLGAGIVDRAARTWRFGVCHLEPASEEPQWAARAAASVAGLLA